MLLPLPNRYDTEVTVEMFDNSKIYYLHFSDIQLAYLWIAKRCIPTLTFNDTCNKLDDAYIRKGKGSRVTVFEDNEITFRIYYWKFDSTTEIYRYRINFI
jgi:hypothetical protein